MNDFMVFMKDNWGWIVSFVTILGGIFVYVYRHILALQRGVQALLRAQMVDNYLPGFEMVYQPDPLKQSIADSWPNSLDDSCAQGEWGWKPRYDLAMTTEDMLENLKRKQ